MKTYLTLFIALLGAFFCSKSTVEAQHCNNSLHARVIDAEHTIPLYGVRIVIDSIQVFQTAEDGSFEIAHMCEGKHIVRLFMLGYKSLELDIYLHKGHNEQVFKLQHNAATSLGVIEINDSYSVLHDNELSAIQHKELKKVQHQDFASALSGIQGVQVASAGANISKAIVGGLRGQRILTSLNGYSIEGQQWGEDHAPEADPFMFENLEVVQGVEKLKTSNEAIGAIVSANNDRLRAEKQHIDLFSAYQSNGNGLKLGIKGVFLPFRDRTWQVKAAFSGQKSGYMKAPSYYLPNTGIHSGFQYIGVFKQSKKWKLSLDQSFSHQEFGILSSAHIGNLSDLKLAILNGKPMRDFGFSYKIALPRQEVKHGLIGIDIRYFLNAHAYFTTKASVQHNKRLEFDDARGNSMDPQLELSLRTWQQELGFRSLLLGTVSLETGVQTRQQLNVWDGVFLIPNFGSNSIGAYTMIIKEKKSWKQTILIRSDKMMRTAFFNKSGVLSAQEAQYNRFSGGYTLVYTSDANYLSLDILSTWRPPSVSELYSNGVHHGSAFFEQGDITLAPEKVNQLLLTYKRTVNPWFNFSINPYVSSFSNFINLLPDTQLVLSVRGAFPKFSYTQQALQLLGLNLQSEIKYTDQWSQIQSLEYLFAYSNQRTPTVKLPYNTTKLALKYAAHTRAWIPELMLQGIYAFKNNTVQYIQDFSAAPKNYFLSNLSASWNSDASDGPLEISFGCNNILNTTYRNYMNTFRYYAAELGRNYYITLQYHIL